MENHFSYYYQIKHAEELAKKNEIILKIYTKKKEKLKFKADMLFARLDFVIEVARQMSMKNKPHTTGISRYPDSSCHVAQKLSEVVNRSLN